MDENYVTTRIDLSKFGWRITFIKGDSMQSTVGVRLEADLSTPDTVRLNPSLLCGVMGFKLVKPSCYLREGPGITVHELDAIFGHIDNIESIIHPTEPHPFFEPKDGVVSTNTLSRDLADPRTKIDALTGKSAGELETKMLQEVISARTIPLNDLRALRPILSQLNIPGGEPVFLKMCESILNGFNQEYKKRKDILFFKLGGKDLNPPVRIVHPDSMSGYSQYSDVSFYKDAVTSSTSIDIQKTAQTEKQRALSSVAGKISSVANKTDIVNPVVPPVVQPMPSGSGVASKASQLSALSAASSESNMEKDSYLKSLGPNQEAFKPQIEEKIVSVERDIVEVIAREKQGLPPQSIYDFLIRSHLFESSLGSIGSVLDNLFEQFAEENPWIDRGSFFVQSRLFVRMEMQRRSSNNSASEDGVKSRTPLSDEMGLTSSFTSMNTAPQSAPPVVSKNPVEATASQPVLPTTHLANQSARRRVPVYQDSPATAFTGIVKAPPPVHHHSVDRNAAAGPASPHSPSTAAPSTAAPPKAGDNFFAALGAAQASGALSSYEVDLNENDYPTETTVKKGATELGTPPRPQLQNAVAARQPATNGVVDTKGAQPAFSTSPGQKSVTPPPKFVPPTLSGQSTPRLSTPPILRSTPSGPTR